LPRKGKIWSGLGKPFGHLLGSSDWGRRFENDYIARTERGSDRPGSIFDEAEIRDVVVLEGGRYRDQEGVGGLGGARGSQVAMGDRGSRDDVELRLDDVYFAAIDGIDSVLAYIDANDSLLPGGENGGCRQTYIAETDYGYSVERHIFF